LPCIREVGAAVVAALGKGSATVWVPPRLRLIMWGLRQLPRPPRLSIDRPTMAPMMSAYLGGGATLLLVAS